jgi:hypothetical protein
VDRNVGERLVAALGAPAASELFDVLERSDTGRAKLIGRLYARDDARWLAELLIEIEEDPNDLVRLRLIEALREGVDRS